MTFKTIRVTLTVKESAAEQVVTEIKEALDLIEADNQIFDDSITVNDRANPPEDWDDNEEEDEDEILEEHLDGNDPDRG